MQSLRKKPAVKIILGSSYELGKQFKSRHMSDLFTPQYSLFKFCLLKVDFLTKNIWAIVEGPLPGLN